MLMAEDLFKMSSWILSNAELINFLITLSQKASNYAKNDSIVNMRFFLNYEEKAMDERLGIILNVRIACMNIFIFSDALALRSQCDGEIQRLEIFDGDEASLSLSSSSHFLMKELHISTRW